MYVKNTMTPNPFTVQYKAPITEVIALMREKNLKRVPVLDGEKIVGIVTESDIQKVSPTKATTLSVFEITYLLSKTRVRDAMTKDVITISPDDLLEEAAVLMREHRVGALLVEENRRLVGIITESDIFEAFINLLGAREPGTRLVIDAEDKTGVLADVASDVSRHNINISRIVSYSKGNGRSDLIFRISTLKPEAVINDLHSKGYKITSVVKREN